MNRVYKFRIYPTKLQEIELKKHLWLSKNLWNNLLSFSKDHYQSYDLFPTKNTLQMMSKGEGMYSQTRQEVSHRVFESIMRIFKLRKKGIKCGFPRFKNIDRTKSLYYPQSGFELNKKLSVTPFGELSIVKHRRIKGEIKTLSLKREPTGKWYAIFISEYEPKIKINKGKEIGIDLGLKSFATLSNGKIISNPKHLQKQEDKLAFLQRNLTRCKKGSHNRNKARYKVALLHEKVSNTRKDFLHKLSDKLTSRYSRIIMEDLQSKDMVENGFGKEINDTGWGMFANMIRYKAEEAGSEAVFVDPKYTTQECSKCGTRSRKTLAERTHKCPACGLKLDRDVNAAKVILKRATAGLVGCNACEVEAIASSMKQEAHTL